MAGRAFGRVERTAADETDADRVEIGGADAQHRDRLRFVSRRCLAVNLKLQESAAAKRLIAGGARPDDGAVGVQPLFHAPHEVEASGAIVFARRQNEGHRQQARRFDADVHPVHVDEAAHHEPGAGEQHQRERQLRHNQRRRPAPSTYAARSRPSSLFEDFIDVGLGDVQRGRKAEHNSRQQADGEEEHEDVRVHVERHPVRLADVLRLAIEPPNAQIADAQTDDAADEREENALDEQLPDDAPPGGAEREANGNFARPMRRARQQQIGDVRAGDEQHERDGAHQRPENSFDLRAQDAIEEGGHDGADVLVAVLILRRELVRDAFHLAARLLESRTVRQPTVCDELALLPRPAKHRRPLRHRHPDLVLERPLESGRHDADDRRGDRVDANRFADDGRVGGITRLPDVGADQRHGRRVGCIVLRKKRAALHGFDADQIEGIRRDEPARIRFRQPVVAADDHRAALNQRDAGKRAACATPVLEVLKRHAESASTRIAHVEPHDPVWSIEGEPSKKHGVDEGEHGAVGADPERQRRERRERNPAVLDQPSRGKAQILQNAHIRPPPFPRAA